MGTLKLGFGENRLSPQKPLPPGDYSVETISQGARISQGERQLKFTRQAHQGKAAHLGQDYRRASGPIPRSKFTWYVYPRVEKY